MFHHKDLDINIILVHFGSCLTLFKYDVGVLLEYKELYMSVVRIVLQCGKCIWFQSGGEQDDLILFVDN